MTTPPDRLPPARLRRRVGLTSSRAEWESVGRLAADDLLKALQTVAAGRQESAAWLDFGCGCGRIVHYLKAAGIQNLWGVDVD